VQSGEERVERRRTEVDEALLMKDVWEVGREELGC
jgi:hypothetical protein